jgi:hypothetical protein
VKIKKEYVIIVAAMIVPFGFVALGLWKTYELMKKGKKDETNEPKQPIR